MTAPAITPGEMTRAAALPHALILGACLLGAIIFIALISLVWQPFDPNGMDLGARLIRPDLIHLFGTDSYGRDVLAQTMAAARPALFVPLASIGLAMIIGVPMGLWAALSGPWADHGLMRLSDVIFAFPALLTAMLLAASLGPGMLGAILAIGLFNIPVFARVARSAARREMQLDYVAAARALGLGRRGLAIRHLLPNIADGLIVQAAIQASLALVADVGLAYIGLGVQPPHPSWGRMLADAQTLYLDAPWLVLAPGGAVLIGVLALTLLADGIRQYLSDTHQGVRK